MDFPRTGKKVIKFAENIEVKNIRKQHNPGGKVYITSANLCECSDDSGQQIAIKVDKTLEIIQIPPIITYKAQRSIILQINIFRSLSPSMLFTAVEFDKIFS